MEIYLAQALKMLFLQVKNEFVTYVIHLLYVCGEKKVNCPEYIYVIFYKGSIFGWKSCQEISNSYFWGRFLCSCCRKVKKKLGEISVQV